MAKQAPKRIMWVLVSVVLALMLIGCTPPQTTDQAPDTNNQDQEPVPPKPKQPAPPIDATPPVATVTVTIVEWKMTLDKGTVPAGKIKFVVMNDGPRFPHALSIEEKSTGKAVGTQVAVNVDEIDTMEVTLAPGTYTLFSPLSGNREKGMETTLKVQ